jgi:hypothetical protein
MITEFLCDGTGSEGDISNRTAAVFASAAFARACLPYGLPNSPEEVLEDVRGRVDVWLYALLDAMTYGSTCEKCEAWASSWGYIVKWVFMDAITKAEYHVRIP